jgi:hypothetical protein
MSLSNCEIAKKIVFHSNGNTSCFEKRFNTIETILNLKNTPDIEFWQNLLKTKDPVVACAILNSEFSPEEIKETSVSIISTTVSNPSKNCFVPFIFSCDAKTLSELPFSVCDFIVDNIDWFDFSEQVNDFIKKYPETNTLPFSNTEIEILLLSKLVNGKAEIYPPAYSYYQFVEYCSEQSFEKVKPNINNLHDNIITAIINNNNLSKELREDALLFGMDISQIKSLPNTSDLTDIYKSAIYGASISNGNLKVGIAKKCRQCIDNLVKFNLLPESCELDLIDRLITNDVLIFPTTTIKFIENTKNPIVIDKVLKSDNVNLYSYAINNPITTHSQVVDTFNKFLNTAFFCSEIQKVIFFSSCSKFTLPINLYDKMLNTFKGAKYRTAIASNNQLKKAIATSPNTPNSVLDKLIDDTDDFTTNSIIPLVHFNKSSKKFDVEIAKKFLKTLSTILTEPQEFKVNNPNFYLPSLDSDNGKELEKILKEATENSYNTSITACANNYLQVLYEQNIIYKAKKCLETLNFDTENIDVLTTIKQILKHNILDFHNTEKEVCLEYLFYKNLLNHIDVYKTVDELLEQKICQEKNTPTLSIR